MFVIQVNEYKFTKGVFVMAIIVLLSISLGDSITVHITLIAEPDQHQELVQYQY